MADKKRELTPREAAIESGVLWNKLTDAPTDTGVTFIKYLWEERKAELELMAQEDVDKICDIIADYS